jgi:lipoprotein
MKAKLAVIGLCLVALSGCGGSSANENRKIGETNTKFNFSHQMIKLKLNLFLIHKSKV